METQEIHIDWDGPFSYKEAIDKFDDEKKDYGIYQLYGTHPVYGLDTLLYIGMAQEQTLSARISQHEYRFGKYWLPVATHLFIGRLIGNTPNPNAWSKEIRLAEKLLIVAHCPTLNSSGINLEVREDDEEFNLHVFNWGKIEKLLPEVSGKRFSYFDMVNDNYSL